MIEASGAIKTHRSNNRELSQFEDIFYRGFGGIEGRRSDERRAIGHCEGGAAKGRLRAVRRRSDSLE